MTPLDEPTTGREMRSGHPARCVSRTCPVIMVPSGDIWALASASASDGPDNVVGKGLAARSGRHVHCECNVERVAADLETGPGELRGSVLLYGRARRGSPSPVSVPVPDVALEIVTP